MHRLVLSKNIILAGALTLCLSLSGCGSAAYVNGSSVSEGSGVIDATGQLSDSGKAGTPDNNKKKKTKSDSAGTGNTQADPSGSAGSDGAGSSDEAADQFGQSQTSDASTGETATDGTAQEAPSGPGSRDNTPVIYVPESPGAVLYGNEFITIDASNADQGYICVEYFGSSPKVKLQITCPNTTTYTYNLMGGTEVFPLTSDSGTYSVGVYENISGTEYSTCFRGDIPVEISNAFGPYLYPNQYVNFNASSECVSVASELAYTANSDLDVVANVYNYVIDNVVYDSELANSVESGYLPDPDRTLASCKGICLDYACLMSSMLRSQGIPTHLEVGYASTAYHAWISVYLDQTGWVNGIVEFNGTSWELMDPTFAASASVDELKEFIGDGSNYDTKYIY